MDNQKTYSAILHQNARDEKCNKPDKVLEVEDELSQRTASLELSMKRQEEQLQEIKGTLQAYSVNNKQDKLTVNRKRAECAPQVVYYPVIQQALPRLQIATTQIHPLIHK